MKDNSKIIIHTDGGSRGNPGPSAIGVIIKGGDKEKKYSEFLGKRTNNEAEYEAVIFALKKTRQLFGKEKIKKSDVEVFVDSELIGRQLSGVYKIEEERFFPFFMKVWNLKMDFGSVKFKIVPRAKNDGADKLVNEALDAKEQGALL